MGAFLDKPMTEKTVCSGEGKTLKYGMSAMQGWRKDMEDAHVCRLDFGWDGWSIFGVFDGHAGASVSKYLSEHIVDCIKEKTDFSGVEGVENVLEGVKKGFMYVDERLLRDPDYANGINRGGSTAIAVLISPKHIVWANCGDSRGFLCQNSDVAWATEDHKPHNAKEKARIEKAGGTVMNQRVNGTLAVSRALGDFEYKQNLSFPPCEQLVSPEPDVTVLPRKQGDEFIFLACDGVYDVMSNEEIAKYIRHKLELTDNHSQICSDLIDYCLNKGSRDNMSAILITFPAAPKVSEEAIKKEEKLQTEAKDAIEIELQKMTENATQHIDLDEHGVFQRLTELLGARFDMIGMKQMISKRLDELKKEKFGDIPDDFSSEEQDEPSEFTAMPTKPDVKLFTAEGVIDTHNNMEVDTNTKQIVSSTRADKSH